MLGAASRLTPNLTLSEAVVEEWISVGTLKEKITAKPQQVVD